MFRILVMNGLLISLILIWTSAAKEPSTETLIKSSPELPRDPLDHYPNVEKETNMDIRGTNNLCKLDHGGVCVKKKKSCPSHLPSEKSPGKPYCSKRHRCCYPDPTTPAPTVLSPTNPISEDPTKPAPTVLAPTTPISEDVSWTDIRNACIKGNNFAIYEPIENIDICKEKCVEEAGVSCQSVEFSSVEQMCSISDTRSDSDDYAEPCFVDGWVFAEIELNTDVSWTDIRNACIKGNNFAIYEPVENIDICKEKCVEEAGVSCQSVEFSSVEQMCSISDTRSDSDDYAEPCFVDGWVFAEIELNTGPITDVSPTPMVPNNNSTNDLNTDVPPTSMVPNNNKTNGVSCNLAWTHEEDRPLIMIRETHVIIPLISADISDDPNRIPEAIKLIYACPGEGNAFQHIEGVHTKLHGECVGTNLFKVCVNNYPEILDLSQLSCSSQIQPSIIKQDNDTSYKKTCADIGGDLYKMGYIYGDYREFKDLDAKMCFRDDDQTILWTSTSVNRIDISPSMRYKDSMNFRQAHEFAMNTLYSQKSHQELVKEVLHNEATSVWNDEDCRKHGGHCVRGGTPCPEHLPHHTSPGKPFCSSFYRCCYSGQCTPTTCTYKGQTGYCSLDSVSGTTGVGSQECKNGCQCYIKDSKSLHLFKSMQERAEFSKLLRAGDGDGDVTTTCGGGGGEPTLICLLEEPQSKKSFLKTHVRTPKGCVIDLGFNLQHGFPPIIFEETLYGIQKYHGKKYAHGEKLTFACTGQDNRFKTLKTDDSEPIYEVIVQCYDGQHTIKVNNNDDDEDDDDDADGKNCIQKMGHFIDKFACLNENEKISITERNGLPGKCGMKDENVKKGNIYQIGYAINQLKIVPLIDICFDKELGTTIWTRHVLQGQYIGNYDSNEKDQVWNKFGFPDKIKNKLDDIYKAPSQWRIFEKYLFKTDYMCNKGNREFYLVKGHMATKSDFVTTSEQAATYYYMNAVPQWQYINGQSGNWRLIERRVHALAKDKRKQLEIFSGGYDILKLESRDSSINNIGKDILLGNYYESDNQIVTKTVPVPAFTWKIVLDKERKLGIAFVVSNNPFMGAVAAAAMITTCDLKCTDIIWLQTPNSATIKPYERFKEPERGLTICCGINEFLKSYKQIGPIEEITNPGDIEPLNNKD